MNKKKGFTLVEVLAVVIVLGVISVIIYPVLNGILEDNRKKAFEQSLNGIARSAEMYKAANNNKFEVMEHDDENLELSYENNWVSGTISVEEIDGADKIYLSGFYDGEFCGTGYENHFSINKGECPSLTPDYCFDYSENMITYYHDEYSACSSVITIPEDINGHEIYYIGVGAFSESRVSSVTLSKNLVAIAPIAFRDSNLQKLYTENASNLEYIGEGAFADTYISNIDFSDMPSLAVIEDDAFADSNLGGTLDFSSLKELQYIGDDAFTYNAIDSVNITGLENLEYIGEDAFSDNTLNGNINIENNSNLVYIGNDAFGDSYSTVSLLNISNNPKLESIDAYAFGYTYIKDLKILNNPSLEYIRTGAFYSSSIQNIDFTGSNAIKHIGEDAFSRNRLKSFDFSQFQNLEYIGGFAFAHNSLTSVELNNLSSLAEIGSYAFENNKIQELTISNLTNISTIGLNAFYNNSISSLTLSNLPSLTELSDSLFARNNLETLTLSNLPALNRIGSSAFNANSLKEVTISGLSNLTTIGSNAFKENEINSLKLENLSSLISIENYAFSENEITTFDYNLPSLSTIGGYAFKDNSISSISFANLPNLSSIGTAAFNDNQLPESSAYIYQIGTKELVSYGGTASSITLPTNTTTIGVSAFTGNKNITTANLSANISLTNIKNSAFYNCSNLTSVTLPSNLTTIGSSAFQSTKLSQITIPQSVTSIGSSAFSSKATWSTVTIEYNTDKAKYRFTPNWTSIGWPNSLKPTPSPVNYTLVTNTPNDFDFFGSYYKVTVPTTGTYKLEVWGAQGGYRSSSDYGGKGGYSYGDISLTEGDILFVYVGGSGNEGGYNGGGIRQNYYGGGGATDIRVSQNSLYARVIVAGGGGSDGASNKNGMYGGGASGGSSTQYCGSLGYGGTISGNAGGSSYVTSTSTENVTNIASAYSGFGFGGNGISYANGFGGAGGGGWYGGTGAYPDGSGDDDRGGGGGSGWLYTSSKFSSWQSGNPTDADKWLLDNRYYLTNSSSKNGGSSAIQPDGTTTVGHSGNGYARITFVS